MRSILIPLLTLTACSPDLGSTSVREGDTTETGAPEPDLPADAPAWLVVDGQGVVVGTLDSPAPEAIADPLDIFASIERAYVSVDGYGFVLSDGGATFLQLAHDHVMFTGPNCTGTGLDWIATYGVDTTKGLVAEDCSDAGLAALIDSVQLHYGQEAIVSEWLALNWPGELGWLMTRSQVGRYYRLPMDQAWPEMFQARSRNTNVGGCEQFAEPLDVCGVELVQVVWKPTFGAGPYSIVLE